MSLITEKVGSENMNETITYAEIAKQYNGEWVLLGDTKASKGPKILRGKVLWHSKDREEVYRKAMELRPKHSAVLFMGKPPKGMEFAL